MSTTAAGAQPSPQQQIGSRVRLAREARQWTEEEFARSLELANTRPVREIEAGKRLPSADELLKICETTKRDLDFFMDPFALDGTERFSWRVTKKVPGATLTKFEGQARGWISLLKRMRSRQAVVAGRDRPAFMLDSDSRYEEAWDWAEELALRLKLGIVPAETLIDKLESELDVPVLLVDIVHEESKYTRGIAGAAFHMEDLDVILINRSKDPCTRLFNIAHELFHVLTWKRMTPERQELENPKDSEVRRGYRNVERLADNFAAALLAPKESLDELIDPHRRQDVEHLCQVAEKLRVTPRVLGLRLHDIGEIDSRTLEKIRSRRAPREGKHARPGLFSKSFVKMLHRDIKGGQLSVRRAASDTGLGMHGLKKLFKSYSLSPPFDL